MHVRSIVDLGTVPRLGYECWLCIRAVIADSEGRSHRPEELRPLSCHRRSRRESDGTCAPFRDLSKRYPIETLEEALAEGIVVGHPAMPRFTFEPREINALLTYISGLKSREPAGQKQ